MYAMIEADLYVCSFCGQPTAGLRDRHSHDREHPYRLLYLKQVSVPAPPSRWHILLDEEPEDETGYEGNLLAGTHIDMFRRGAEAFTRESRTSIRWNHNGREFVTRGGVTTPDISHPGWAKWKRSLLEEWGIDYDSVVA